LCDDVEGTVVQEEVVTPRRAETFVALEARELMFHERPNVADEIVEGLRGEAADDWPPEKYEPPRRAASPRVSLVYRQPLGQSRAFARQAVIDGSGAERKVATEATAELVAAGFHGGQAQFDLAQERPPQDRCSGTAQQLFLHSVSHSPC
jgi:hypothetical protein